MAGKCSQSPPSHPVQKLFQIVKYAQGRTGGLMHSFRNIYRYIIFVISYFRNVKQQYMFQQNKILRDVKNYKHKPDAFFCLFLVLDQKSWYFVWKGKERKKEIGVDRGLKNLE